MRNGNITLRWFFDVKLILDMTDVKINFAIKYKLQESFRKLITSSFISIYFMYILLNDETRFNMT